MVEISKKAKQQRAYAVVTLIFLAIGVGIFANANSNKEGVFSDEAKLLRKCKGSAKRQISRKPKIVGIYRLIMKKGSDNFRESAITDIIQGLKEYAIKIIIYEPLISDEKYMDSQINNNLQDFKTKSDLIISNRNDDDLDDVKDILVTRDIYRNN